MLPPPPADAGTITAVLLVAPIFQWATALLLFAIFALFLPLSSQRRLIQVWSIAWGAQVVALLRPALSTIGQVTSTQTPFWTTILEPLYWPAHFVFLTAIAIGAIGTTGRVLNVRTERVVLMLSAAVGLIVTLTGADVLARWLQFIATPIVFFGCVQVILMAAKGARAKGLMFMGVAMMVTGTLTTLYLFANFETSQATSIARLIGLVRHTSGYGDALALALLGGAAIVVIVREALLDVERLQEKRIVDVAASESRLNGIIQAAQEAIMTADASGRVDLVNAAAAQLFRISQTAAVGRTLESFIPEISTSLEGERALSNPPDAGRGLLGTHLGHAARADGTTFPVEFTIGRLSSGGSSGSVLVLRDLTERNAIAAEQEAFERRMAESEKMLAIGRVVSGVAHELNNPLAVVLGQSEQLADAAPAGEVRAGLRLIHEQAHRARHIVKDLLAFVRHNEDHREPVDLVRLIERTITAQLDIAMSHGVTILADLPRSLPPVMVDPVAVEQILVNLIDNALDAAGVDGTARVLATHQGDRLEVAVVDSGHGVADENVVRVFEPFFSTKGPGHGPGLGLTVSRGLAEQQGGTLRLENRPGPGIGARFVLSLPVAPKAASNPVPATNTRTFPPPPVLPDGAPAEVMLIDDEPSVRATLGKMFKRAGWQVREADSGTSAVAWLDAVTDAAGPAVILCDLKMPGMSGRDVFEHLKSRRPALVGRLIFVTGDVVESMSNGFIASSGREVVEKPFTVTEIGRAVERVMQATPTH